MIFVGMENEGSIIFLRCKYMSTKEIMIETVPFLEIFHWETSKDNSHQYCVCEPNNQAEFENLEIHIRKYGYVVTIQGMSYVCLDIGEYLYWTMWESIEKPLLINRLHI